MARESWHLDKRIPIAIIGIILVQSGSIIWGAAKLDSRVEVTENTLAARASKGLETLTQTAQNTNDISGLKVEVTSLKEAIRRIDANTQVIADRIYNDKKNR